MQPEREPAHPTRRRVLGAAVWSAHVIAVVEPAPVFASSTSVTVTASKTTTRLVLTFSNGAAGMSATITSVTYTLVAVPVAVVMSPTVVTNTLGGTSTGNALSADPATVRTYTVVYVYNGQTFTTVVSA